MFLSAAKLGISAEIAKEKDNKNEVAKYSDEKGKNVLQMWTPSLWLINLHL